MTLLVGSDTEPTTTDYTALPVGTAQGKEITSSAAGNANKFYIHLSNGSASDGLALGVWDASGNLLWSYDLTDTSTSGWNVIDVSPTISISAATIYHLGFQRENIGVPDPGHDNGSYTDTIVSSTGQTYPTMPDPISLSYSAGPIFAMYLAEEATGTVIEVPTGPRRRGHGY